MIHPDAARTFRGLIAALTAAIALFWLPLAVVLIGVLA